MKEAEEEEEEVQEAMDGREETERMRTKGYRK